MDSMTEGSERMRNEVRKRSYTKSYVYALLGSGIIGVGMNLWLNLDKPIVLPFFPDILDALSVILVGCVLIYEAVGQFRLRSST